jgi:hypothetical protein
MIPDLPRVVDAAFAAAPKHAIYYRSAAAGGDRSGSIAGRIAAARRSQLENDLDAAVLRLAHAGGGRHPVVVLAAAADRHLVARHAEAGERACDVAGAPFRQALVVSRASLSGRCSR